MTDDEVSWSAQVGTNRARIEVGRFAVEIEDRRPAGGFQAVRFHQVGGEWVRFGEVTA
jgi:hypothetical protein